MSAPSSPTMPRWAQVDKLSSLSSARKMMLAGAAAVLALFLVLTLSQVHSSPLRIGTAAHGEQHDPIDDVFNSTLGVSQTALLYTMRSMESTDQKPTVPKDLGDQYARAIGPPRLDGPGRWIHELAGRVR